MGRSPLPLRMGLVLAAVPLGVVAGLALFGALAWRPALLAAGVILAGALALGRLWVRDVAHILEAMQGAEPGGPPPLLSATARIAAEGARLARALARQEGEARDRAEAERELVQRLPDPMVVLGPGRAVLRANPAATTLFGPAIGAMLRHPRLRAALDRAAAEQQVLTETVTVPGGEEIEATLVPLARPLSDGGRMVAVLADRSRERAVERMRADFVANASHELRTPLASLIGFIDTLRGPAADDPPAQARFLGIMAEQAQRMNRLIDDLLSLSRIELTEHTQPHEDVDLAALLRRQAAALEPQVRARRMRVVLELAGSMPPVPGDADQLAQVAQNLIDNAVKYGRAGGTIRVAAAPAPAGAPWPPRPGIAVSVADDGQGIPRAHLPRLTERFYRADKQGSRAVGGTGLGLAIVKHIVNRHRGRLSIDSTEGVGTTVTVWLPMAAPAAAGNGAADTA